MAVMMVQRDCNLQPGPACVKLEREMFFFPPPSFDSFRLLGNEKQSKASCWDHVKEKG